MNVIMELHQKRIFMSLWRVYKLTREWILTAIPIPYGFSVFFHSSCFWVTKWINCQTLRFVCRWHLLDWMVWGISWMSPGDNWINICSKAFFTGLPWPSEKYACSLVICKFRIRFLFWRLPFGSALPLMDFVLFGAYSARLVSCF